MVKLAGKDICSGCGACVQICQKHCINMYEDSEGFLYPHIDIDRCIQCGTCEKICPVIQKKDVRKPLHVYAAKNTNEAIRAASASGGMFTLLAEHIIDDNGVVFGAKFNDKGEVVHDYTETIKGLSAFRGSKYVQSITGEIFKQTRAFLEQGRKVLFSGTPCQIAGLKSYLSKNYENLLTVAIVCHGVPGPGVWRKYSACSDSATKKDGATKNRKGGPFMAGFLSNLYLRPSCYQCQTKSLNSGSDITLGDYWGIKKIVPEFTDNKGVSLVLIHTIKGQEIYKQLKKDDVETDYSSALAGNACIEKSVTMPIKRAIFFQRWQSENIISLINELTYISLWNQIKNIIRRKLCELPS